MNKKNYYDINYYKIINGLNFDADLLYIAEKCIIDNEDNKISKDNVEKLLQKINIRKTITKVEYRTILYILKNYKFSDITYEYFLDKLIKYD